MTAQKVKPSSIFLSGQPRAERPLLEFLLDFYRLLFTFKAG